MNWLADYFAQRTPALSISLAAWPPLRLGPEGPVLQSPRCLPYPGATLVFRPGGRISQGEQNVELPACYEMRAPTPSQATEWARKADGSAFFESVKIFAPSRYNPDILVTINDSLAFVPVFSADGAPGFSGTCTERAAGAPGDSQMALPWSFQGYITI
ncbi:hypothetical protein [Paraburkholderia lycopersici]|uniref:Uncharacterized protein n=1 Tax=Paraburkholderia lycopersici TaxID=416944 RepID=A0A1G6SF97_9BURK|nr:hypothetical protein [Paraburkholderia lycopersici]SDD15453.1 hypothetical protein SAMN05421548_11549 [Paraburkholderia lycopersici]